MAFTRFTAALQGQLTGFLKKEKQAGARAWTQAIRATADDAKARWRAALRRHGLGGFEKAVQVRVYPTKGVSLRAAAEVYSKAVYKRAGGAFDFLDMVETGATVRPVQFGYLWIPRGDLPRRPARGASTRKAQPSDYGTLLRFLPVAGTQYALAVLRSSGEVLFVGVKVTRFLPRPLALQEESAAAAATIDERAVAAWERESQRAGVAA